MTEKKTEALNLALGYMDGTLVTDHMTGYERKRHVMQCIREALAEQPAQRKPLTDEQRNWVVATCPTPRHIIDTVEKMHGIKGDA